jgi:small subunit ribosomal protein S4
MWDSARIQKEHGLKEKYGLKNLRELWMLDSELRRVKQNVRNVLSGKASEETGSSIMSRLARYNVVGRDAKLDDLLVLDVESLLERRLETVVLRKGLSRTMKQARQFVAHGLITVAGRRMTSPGYLVKANEEDSVAYYKLIKLNEPEQQVQVLATQAGHAAATETVTAQQETETKQEQQAGAERKEGGA